jgi:hypothetical protein
MVMLNVIVTMMSMVATVMVVVRPMPSGMVMMGMIATVVMAVYGSSCVVLAALCWMLRGTRTRRSKKLGLLGILQVDRTRQNVLLALLYFVLILRRAASGIWARRVRQVAGAGRIARRLRLPRKY